jgi:predicted phage replisome organizer
MSDNKKYYYLKLKDNFFESDAMLVLESMQDGYLYSNILLKLYLRSLKNRGKLMFSEKIPYNASILAKITRHSVGVVEKALKIFTELELIEVLSDGAIYMTDIQNHIGSSSSEADRKRAYRAEINERRTLLLGQTSGQMSHQMSSNCPDKSPPEIEIEIDINNNKKSIVQSDDLNQAQNLKNDIDNFFEKAWKEYPAKRGKSKIKDKQKKVLFKIGEEILRCIERYKKDKQDWKEWQNGSTFFNGGYVDYLDKNYDESALKNTTPKPSFDVKSKVPQHNFDQRDYSDADYDSFISNNKGSDG